MTLERGQRELSGVMGTSCTFMVVVVMRVISSVKIHQTDS